MQMPKQQTDPLKWAVGGLTVLAVLLGLFLYLMTVSARDGGLTARNPFGNGAGGLVVVLSAIIALLMGISAPVAAMNLWKDGKRNKRQSGNDYENIESARFYSTILHVFGVLLFTAMNISALLVLTVFMTTSLDDLGMVTTQEQAEIIVKLVGALFFWPLGVMVTRMIKDLYRIDEREAYDIDPYFLVSSVALVSSAVIVSRQDLMEDWQTLVSAFVVFLVLESAISGVVSVMHQTAQAGERLATTAISIYVIEEKKVNIVHKFLHWIGLRIPSVEERRSYREMSFTKEMDYEARQHLALILGDKPSAEFWINHASADQVEYFGKTYLFWSKEEGKFKMRPLARRKLDEMYLRPY